MAGNTVEPRGTDQNGVDAITADEIYGDGELPADAELSSPAARGSAGDRRANPGHE